MRELSRVFAPKSIAVFGASLETGTSGARAIKHLQEGRFQGPIVPINPKHAGETHAGIRWYASARDYGDTLDHAIILVRAATVPSVLESCVEAGIKSVSILAGGFAESGEQGKLLQQKVAAAAKKAGMSVLGPNCLGYANVAEGVFATGAGVFEGTWPQNGPLAILSQSGSVAGDIMVRAHARGIGCRLWISTGNEIDISIADAIDYAAESEGIRAILLYLETVRDLEGFKRALEQARRRGIRVIAVRPGRTAAGARAVESHTASLVSANALYEAFLAKHGVVRADSLSEMVDVVQVDLALRGSAAGVAVATASGGTAALTADAAAENGVRMASISAEGQAKLRELVPHCTPGNPIDITGVLNEKPQILRPFLSAVLDERNVDCLVMIHGSTMLWLDRGRRIAATLAELSREHETKSLIFVGALPPELSRLMGDAGITLFEDSVALMRAIGRITPPAVQEDPHEKQMASTPAHHTAMLDEDKALEFLERPVGIPVVARRVVTSEEALGRQAESLGYPLAAKAVLPGVAHKTELGAVRLNIRSHEELKQAWRELAGLCKSRHCTEKILVEEMIDDAVAELLISGMVDPMLGPFVTVAAGGSLTELVQDAVVRCAPLDSDEALAMLKALRGWRRLAVSRSGRAGSEQEVVAAIVALSQALSQGRIREIEINPFLLRPRGSCAVDAVVAMDAESKD